MRFMTVFKATGEQMSVLALDVAVTGGTLTLIDEASFMATLREENTIVRLWIDEDEGGVMVMATVVDPTDPTTPIAEQLELAEREMVFQPALERSGIRWYRLQQPWWQE